MRHGYMCLILILSLYVNVYAQVFYPVDAAYTFAGSTACGSEQLGVESQPAQGSAYSTIERNTGSGSGIACPAGTSPNNNFPSQGFTTQASPPDVSLDPDYFSFTVTPDAANGWSLEFSTTDQLSMVVSHDEGPTAVDVYFAVDGGAFVRLGSTATIGTSATTHTFAFATAVSALASIEFRVYGYSAVLESGRLIVDDVQLSGRAVNGTIDASLVISEIMKDPDNVLDSAGEWFEVFNASDTYVDMEGWGIEDLGTNSHAVGRSVIVAPGEFAVICRSADDTANGGFACTYEGVFTLSNGADEIRLCSSSPCTSGNEVDRVEYDDGVLWPDPTGASMVFFGDSSDDNNDGTNWAVAIEREDAYSNPGVDCGGAGEPDCGSPGTQGVQGNLPVELVAFEALVDGDAVFLQWETASETNNAGFEVQTRDKERWQVAGFVVGQGTTLDARRYAYRLDGLAPGMHRFRLKQIDYDGQFAYSPEVEVAVSVPGMYHLSDVYPNPFNPTAQFSLSVARAQHVSVAVYNMLGQQVNLLYDGRLPGGCARTFQVEGSQLAGGVYLLRVAGEQFATSRLVTLLK